MKIANYKKSVIEILNNKLCSKQEDKDERSKGFVYEISIDIEMIYNILTDAEKTSEYMNKSLYDGIQYSLSKSYEAICIQKKVLSEADTYSLGRKDSVIICQDICRNEWESENSEK